MVTKTMNTLLVGPSWKARLCILAAAAELAAGGALIARTPCYPHPLLVLLARRGLAFEAIEEPDGTGLVHVRRPA